MVKITNQDLETAILKANEYGLNRLKVIKCEIKPKEWHGTNETSHDCIIDVETIDKNE